MAGKSTFLRTIGVNLILANSGTVVVITSYSIHYTKLYDLTGPSLMPGGSKAAWEHIKPIFQNISAKVDGNVPCCDWVGNNGAGHFVKMVHNGIEYGDMQLISEAYHLLKDVGGLSHDEMSKVFDEWNKGDLDSYLTEITRDIV